MVTEAEVREAQEEIAKQVRMAEAAIANARQIADNFNLPFEYKLTGPKDDDWEESDWNDSGCSF